MTLDDLLDEYFSIGVKEGREGRDHDDIEGSAERTRAKIRACFADRQMPAALSASPAQPVAIKPLEWSTQTRQGWTVHVAKGLGCTYEASAKVWNNGWMWGRVEDDSNFDAEDEETAKAAAQSDYEARIRSVLSAPLPEIEGGDKGDGWQPMSTAPTDGKHCILAVKEGPFIYSVQGAFQAGEWNAVHRNNVTPLAWMPNVRLPDEFRTIALTDAGKP